MISHLNIFTNKGYKIAEKKKSANLGFIIISIRSILHFIIFCFKIFFKAFLIRMLYNKDSKVICKIFFVSVLLSAAVERCFVSCMGDFFREFFFEYFFELHYFFMPFFSLVTFFSIFFSTFF